MNFLTSQSTGVQYYTGQFFDVKQITEAGHKKVQQGSRQMYDVLHCKDTQSYICLNISQFFKCWPFHFFIFFIFLCRAVLKLGCINFYFCSNLLIGIICLFTKLKTI